MSELKRSARFDPTMRYRFDLRRWWVAEPVKWVAWLMSNPSNADGHKDDPTIKRVIHFSRSWGFDGAIVVNTSPVIGSTPQLAARALSADRDYGMERVYQNFEFIEAAGKMASLHVAAFGANPFYRLSLKQFENFGNPLYCLGVTRNSSPKHPLARGKHRIPDTAQPVVWHWSPRDNAPSAEPAHIQIGDTAYPQGPRGLQ